MTLWLSSIGAVVSNLVLQPLRRLRRPAEEQSQR